MRTSEYPYPDELKYVIFTDIHGLYESRKTILEIYFKESELKEQIEQDTSSSKNILQKLFHKLYRVLYQKVFLSNKI